MLGVNLDPQTAHIATAICLTLFGVLGAFDGIYFHMIKYKLHQHPPAASSVFVVLDASSAAQAINERNKKFWQYSC